jgi:integrase
MSANNKNSKKYKSGEKALSPDEYERMLAACSTLEDRVMILFQVTLGLRRSDLAEIKIANIDIANNLVTYVEKKKGNRIRVVPIGDRLKQEITMLINTIDTKKQKTLFSVGDRQMYNRFNTIAKVAGIRPGENIPIHALRATACQFMTDAGWRIEEIAEIIGDSIETLQRHYLVPSKARIMQTAREKEVIAGPAWGTRRER